MKNSLCCLSGFVFACLVILLYATSCFGQLSKNELLNYSELVKKRNNSTVTVSQSIIDAYDDYLKKHPNDVRVYTQKCLFLDNCYSDEYEEYNPYWEEADLCFEEGSKRFRDDFYFKLHHCLQFYGDTAKIYQENVVTEYEEGGQMGSAIWLVYKRLAWDYFYSKEYQKTLRNLDKLKAINDTLDLPMLRLRTYIKLDRKEVAVSIAEHLYVKDSVKYCTNQLGDYALKLGETDLAIKIYKQVMVDTTAYIDNANLADAFVEKGLYDEARSYLVRDTLRSYKQLESKLALWSHDLKYSPTDTLKSMYRELIAVDWQTDLFGFKNYLMLFKRGTFCFGWYNITAVIFLLIFIAILALLPYIVVLPIHYIGCYFVKRESVPPVLFNWNLKDFWIVLAVYFIGSFFADWLFYYDFNIGYYFLDKEIYFGLNGNEVSQELANLSLVFMVFLAVVGVYLIFKEKLSNVFGEPKLIFQNILYGVGYCFLLLFLTTVFSKVFGLGVHTDATFLASNVNEIKSVIVFWGGPIAFLFVAFIVPIYEEIIFRGVILSSCEKLIYYIPANIFQAVLFALAHDNLKLFVFYFAFGVTASYLRNKTKSFVAPITLHVMNNAIAVASIYASIDAEMFIN